MMLRHYHQRRQRSPLTSPDANYVGVLMDYVCWSICLTSGGLLDLRLAAHGSFARQVTDGTLPETDIATSPYWKPQLLGMLIPWRVHEQVPLTKRRLHNPPKNGFFESFFGNPGRMWGHDFETH